MSEEKIHSVDDIAEEVLNLPIDRFRYNAVSGNLTVLDSKKVPLFYIGAIPRSSKEYIVRIVALSGREHLGKDWILGNRFARLLKTMEEQSQVEEVTELYKQLMKR